MSSTRRFRLHVSRAVEDAAETGVSDAESGPAVSEPLGCSLPLPAGTFRSDVVCALTDENGRHLGVQTSVLARWPDASPKWIFVEFSAPWRTTDSVYSLTVSGSAPISEPELAETQGSAIQIRSCGLVLTIAPHQRVLMTDRDREVGSISIEATSADGATQQLDIDSVSIERNGSRRATALAQGHIRIAETPIAAELRVTAYAECPQIRCDLTVHNPRRARHEGNYWELGDEGSILFRQLAVELHQASDRGEAFYCESPGVWRSSPGYVSIYQESSGGENWRSGTHVDRSGTVPMTRAGYIVEIAGHQQTGRRAQPAVQVIGTDRSWAGTLLRFWEEFPSAVRVDSSNRIVLEPFPGAFPSLHELQGGERKTRTWILAHGDAATARSAIARALQPSTVAVETAVLRNSGTLPFLNADEDQRHSAILSLALEGGNSFAAKRERVDDYGWRNFGDLHADHESAFLTESADFVSHYNNQYDAVFGFGFQYLRTGDRRWWRLMDDLARHVADVDIYHTTEDKAAYNGGMFWHTCHYTDAGRSSHRSYPRAKGIAGGGPAAEQNYNAGLALHYLLTGWVPSRDAAIGLARWVIEMDDGSRTPFRWLARGHTGLATASGTPRYHGPGRAGGNSINALVTAFDLTGDRTYLDKAEQLIRRCVHPADDIAALNLLDAERRWYYTVFLDAVGRYLWYKADRSELDATYDYARRSLLHYAHWMRDHEYPYLDKPEILEYPTETWSAQDARKSDVLAWAALCERGAERQAFLAASHRFLDDVLTRLPGFSGVSYTRPLALMLSRGYAGAWVTAHDEAFLPPAPVAAADPPPARFEPQKVVALGRARVLAGLTAVLALIVLVGLALR